MTTKGRRFPPEPLSPAEVDALLHACSRRAPTGIRNRALIAVLYRSGLRIGEALALRLADVDLEACSIRVLHGKGDRSSTVGLDPGAVALLERWLEQRRQLGLGRAVTIFCTLKGDPVRQKYVRALLARLRWKAGIEKRVHAHGFRHTHATELRREGVGIGIISKQLGHSSIATTARYLDHVSPVEVIDTIRRRTWTDEAA
jgi:integrase